MDFCRSVFVSGGFPANCQLEQKLMSPSFPKLGSLDDLFSCHSMEQQGDINTEWLSIFVEDCLSSSGSCISMPPNPQSTTHNAQVTTTPSSKPDVIKKPKLTTNNISLSLHKPLVPSKARSKRRTTKGTSGSSWAQEYSVFNTDPPLLQQAYWLAESELLVVPKGTSLKKHEEEGRRCRHCLSQRTPQWRAGPEGPKTLCNACGVRYKSGRLLPEYRPAKSPTFVSCKHSNSHKKVLEMRMCSSSTS